jgi:thiamine-phosphate pyrophosphorylase
VRRLFVRPITYLITRGEATPANFDKQREMILGVVRAAAENGISLVQIREKQLTTKLLFSLVSDAAAITVDSSTRLMVNDRADVAIGAGADGVHLTAASLPVSLVRSTFGDGLLIGASTHNMTEAAAAKRSGADLAVFGPVFATPGKGEPVGLDELAAVCRSLAPFPVVGLGGIDESNYRDVLNAGASGFAAIRFLNEAGVLNRLGNSL